MSHRCLSPAISILIFSLSTFAVLFSPPSVSAQASCSTVGDAAGNQHIQFDELGQACDEHRQEFLNCAGSEMCQKWVNNSVVTCADEHTLQANVAGDSRAFEDLLASGGMLDGDGRFSQEISVTSNFGLDNDKAQILPENFFKITTQWAYFNFRRLADRLNPSLPSPAPSTASACEAAGTNLGYGHLFSQGESVSYLTNNRPITLLVPPTGANSISSNYFSASPLIVRLFDFGPGTNLTSAGQQFGAALSGKNAIVVVGNEPDISDDGYCDSFGSKSGLFYPESVLRACGQAYATQFNQFLSGVAGRVPVAAAPLALVTQEDTTTLAEAFRQAAISAYQSATTVAINSYCPVNDPQSCIDRHISFYRSVNSSPIYFTEFGPFLDYTQPLPQGSVKTQVDYLESNCSIAQQYPTTPLIKDCGTAERVWLFYMDGNLYNLDGSLVDPNTCGSGAGLGKVCTGGLLNCWWQGNFKDKMYHPEAQVTEAATLCRTEILPAIEDPNYVANELYSRNCNPVFDGGPTDCSVCTEWRHTFPGLYNLGPNYMDTWYTPEFTNYTYEGEKFRDLILALPETKVKARAYMLIAKDIDLNELCERIFGIFPNLFCWVPTAVNPKLLQSPEQKVYIVPFWLEGVRGAFVGSQKLYESLSLPQDSQDLWQTIADNNYAYPASCPDGCVIKKSACEQAAREADVDTSDYLSGDIVKRLVNRICESNVSCGSNERVAVQFSGATAQAKAESIATIILNFLLSFSDGIPLKPQPTVQGWVVSDRATLYLKEYGESIWDKFRLPSEIGLEPTAAKNSPSSLAKVLGLEVIERVDVLADHSFNVTGEDVETDTVTKEVEVECPEGETPPCYDTIEAKIEYTGPTDLHFETEGGTPSEYEQYNRGRALVPPDNFAGWYEHRYHCPQGERISIWSEIANRVPGLAEALGVPAGDTCSEALTGPGPTTTPGQLQCGQPGEPITIMPVGDSITVGTGSTNGQGFRGPLYQRLSAAGYNVTFVGSQTTAGDSGPAASQHHEGYGGYAPQSLISIAGSAASSFTPTIALIHAGTNQLCNRSIEDHTNAVIDMIKAINSNSPTTQILVAKIIKSTHCDSNGSRNVEFNNALAAKVSQLSASGEIINTVIADLDVLTLYTNDYISDNIHPSLDEAEGETGYIKMANAWSTAIQSACSTTTTGPGTPAPDTGINCNQNIPDSALPAGYRGAFKQNFIQKADDWLSNDGNTHHARECYNDVVMRSLNAGINPVFSLTIWLHETDASNYDASSRPLEDFGIHVGVPKEDFNAQITRFLTITQPDHYQNRSDTGICFEGDLTDMQTFMYIFHRGFQGCPDNMDTDYYNAIFGSTSTTTAGDGPWMMVGNCNNIPSYPNDMVCQP